MFVLSEATRKEATCGRLGFHKCILHRYNLYSVSYCSELCRKKEEATEKKQIISLLVQQRTRANRFCFDLHAQQKLEVPAVYH